MNSDPLIQNRFVSALLVTLIIMVMLGLVVAIFRSRGRIQAVLQRQAVTTVFRYFLGGTAVLVLLLSLFPREGLEAGILLYFILWPLLTVQLVTAFLPWQRFMQKSSGVTIVAAGIATAYAVAVDILMLTLAGYVHP